MVRFGGIHGELDDWGSLLEDLAASVEHEMIVGGDFGEGDGEGDAVAVPEEHRVLVPRKSPFNLRLTVGNSFAELVPVVPEEFQGGIGSLDASREASS